MCYLRVVNVMYDPQISNVSKCNTGNEAISKTTESYRTVMFMISHWVENAVI